MDEKEIEKVITSLVQGNASNTINTFTCANLLAKQQAEIEALKVSNMITSFAAGAALGLAGYVLYLTVKD